VSNQLLVFEDMNSFSAAMSFLYDNQDNGNDSFNDRFPDFDSYNSALESFRDEDYVQYEKYPNLLEKVDEGDGTFSIEPTVKFNLIRQLLNRDAMIQIGQKVYKFTSSNVYEIDSNGPFESLIAGRYSDLLSLVAYPVICDETYLGVNDRSFQAVCTNKFFWSNRRRVVGKVREIHAWAFHELIMQTYCQKRFAGIWYKIRHRELVINGSGVFNTIEDGIPFPLSYSVNKHEYNVKSITHTVASMHPLPGSNWRLEFVSNHSYHDCYGDAGCHIDFD